MPELDITPADIAPFATIDEAKLEAMIADALAMARAVAPCVVDFDFEHADAAKAILRQAILRWNDAGSGAVTTQTAGPFGMTIDASTRRSGLFWPSEIKQLQEFCRDSSDSGAWSYDTVAGASPQHADVCSLNFGAQFCSCGAVLTMNAPLWENR